MNQGGKKFPNSPLHCLLHKAKKTFTIFFKVFEDRINELHCSTETRVSQTVKKRKKSAFISIKLSVFSYQSQYAFSCLYNTAFISLSNLLLLTKWKCLQIQKLLCFCIICSQFLFFSPSGKMIKGELHCSYYY